MEQSPGSEPRCNSWVVHPRDARMGLQFHGGACSDSYGPGVSVWGLQVSSGAYVDRWRVPFAYDPRDGFQRAGAALRPRRLLGTWNRGIDRQPGPFCWTRNREADAGRADHRGRNALAVLRPTRIRDSRNADRIRVPSRSDGPETGNQRMANARTRGKARQLSQRIS